MVCDLVETEVYVLDVDCISFQSLAKYNQSSIVKSVCKVVFVVALDLNIDRIVFVVSLLQIGTKSLMSFYVSLLAHVAVLSQQLRLD